MVSYIRFCVFAILAYGLTVFGKPPPFSTVKVSLACEGSDYVGHIQVDDLKRVLHLKKPETSVLASNFTFSVSEIGAGKQLYIKDITPTPHNLYNAEKDIYVDSASRAAFIVQAFGMEIRLHGIIDDLGISHDGKNHVVHRQKRKEDSAPNKIDVMWFFKTVASLFYPSSKDIAEEKSTNKNSIENDPPGDGVAQVSPELFIVFDHQQWKNLKRNRDEVVKYASILIHAVNIRFASSKEPKIDFRLVGVHIIANILEQPFMEESKVKGREGYDIDRVFKMFNKWSYKNRGHFPKHDIAALVTGAILLNMDKNSDKYVNNIKGLAIRGGGACYEDHGIKMSFKGIVAEDRGAFWLGTFTLAHELAHGLGAPHDGVEGAQDCPKSEGFIMSSEGWGKGNKFRFSTCSNKLMKKYINSDQGLCLREQSNKPLSDVNKNVKW